MTGAGTLASTDLQIGGGTLSTDGGALAAGAEAALSSGTLSTTGSETLARIDQSGGTLTGTFTVGDFTQTGGTGTATADRSVVAIGGIASSSATGMAGTNAAGDVTITSSAAGSVNNAGGTGVLGDTSGGTGSVTMVLDGAVSGTTGIEALAGGNGMVAVTANGGVTGTAGDGIFTSAVDGDTVITLAGDVSGTGDGINAVASGAGSVTVTGTGNVTGDADGSGDPTDDGISVSTTSGTVLIDVDGSISGAPGIVAVSATGDITVAGTGDVSDGVDVALLAATGGAGIVSVTRDGVVTGGTDGIVAIAGGASVVGGTGDVTGTLASGITATGDTADVTRDGVVSGGTDGIVATAVTTANVGGTGDVTGTGGIGILATGTVVTVTRDGTISGGTDGIVAAGTDTASVSGTGDVTGATGVGILADGPGGVTVTRDGVVTGDTDGIAASSVDGAVSVTAVQDVTGVTGAGIDAEATGAGAVTVTGGGAVTGATGGILAQAQTGAVSVSGTGATTVTGADGVAITGVISDAGTVDNLLIDRSGAIEAQGSGASGGIIATNAGSGAVTVTTTGPVLLSDAGSTGTGLLAQGTGGGNVAVTANGAVDGGAVGIAASATGAGTVSVTTGAALGGAAAFTGNGIETVAEDGDTVITLGGDVVADADGINAVASGTGAVTVTGTGNVTGDAAGTGNPAFDGIDAQTDSGDIRIDVAGTITGAPGINAQSLNGGNVEITGTGDVSDVVGAGILASTTGGNGNVTVNRDGSVDGGAEGIVASVAGTGTLDLDVTGTNTVDGGATGMSATVGTGTGTVDIAAGAQVRGGVDLANADLAGVAAALATFGDAGGTITVTNAGTVDADNAADSVAIAAGDNVDTAFTNTGTVLGMASSTAGAGAVTLTNDNLWRLNTGGATVMAGASDSLANGGTLDVDSSSLTGIETLTNTGTIMSNGNSTLGGTNVVNTGGTITQIDGATGDVLTLEGAVSSTGGMLAFDVDFSGVTDTADLIVVTGGALSGTTELAFNNTGGAVASLGGPITLIDYDGAFGNTLTFTAPGLPSTGSVVFNVVDNPGGSSLDLQSSANPGIGGIAGGLALTRSLIGAVINRPTSPFVSGLAAADGASCGAGTWGRATGGEAEITGDTTTAAGTFESEVSVDYAGVQGGLDFSCFNAADGGWDLSFGGFAGFNTGDSQQPVFAFDPVLGTLDFTNQTSQIFTDFDQSYAGVYVAAARGQFVSEVQLRYESTDFDISETSVGGGGTLGVLDQSFDSTGYTISGSVSYIVSVNEETGLSFVPTAGFAYSSIETDNIALGGATPGQIVIDDTEMQIGFIGGTLSRAQVLPSGDRAWNYFVTGTVYHDFADDTDSLFVPVAGAAQASQSSNIGTYGELSIGAGFVQILEPGMFGKGRQFNANIRLDGRYGEDIDGWGITAQARVQF